MLPQGLSLSSTSRFLPSLVPVYTYCLGRVGAFESVGELVAVVGCAEGAAVGSIDGAEEIDGCAEGAAVSAEGEAETVGWSVV